MHSTRLQFEYNGYQYRTYDDVEDDNIKTFHYCYKDGKKIDMPWEFYNTSPYRLVTPDEFKQFVQSVEVFIQG